MIYSHHAKKCCRYVESNLECYDTNGMACPIMKGSCFDYMTPIETDTNTNCGDSVPTKPCNPEDDPMRASQTEWNTLYAAYGHFALDALAFIIAVNEVIKKKLHRDPLGCLLNFPFKRLCGFECVEP